jgi:dihydroorotase
MNKVISGGIVVDPRNGIDKQLDILIQDGKIAALDAPGSFSVMEDCEVLEATGCWVTPGLVDLHVHLREPGQEWKETIAHGAWAAIQGGYTTVCAMPNTRPTNDSAEITRFILAKAAAANAARVRPIGAVSIGLKGDQMAPLSELLKAGCVALSDDGEPIHDAGLMRRALEWCRMHGVRISCHEEDKCLSCGGVMNESPLSYRLGLKGMSTLAEDVMVARDIEIGRYTKGKVHICHISSARGVELIRRAKNDGIDITVEVTPHHLLLTEEAVTSYDGNTKMSPPLRTAEEVEELWRGVSDGTIDAIASDHAPHEPDSKEKEFSQATFGILGLQTSLPLLLECVHKGRLTRTRAIEMLSDKPAACFGMEAGSLAKGMLADICIIDPNYHWTYSTDMNLSKSINSPFWGRTMTGIADTVLVGGEIKMKRRELCR